MITLESYHTFFVGIRAFLQSVGLDTDSEGSTWEEIQELEDLLGSPLPVAYKIWLCYYGKHMSNTIFDRFTFTSKDFHTANKELIKGNYELIDYTATIAIGYIEYNQTFILVENINDDPPVTVFVASDVLYPEELKFTSWIRKECIDQVKLWATLHPDEWMSKRKWIYRDIKYRAYTIPEYNKYRKEFTTLIEEEDFRNGCFTLPDQFQERWIAYLEDNQLTHLLNA